MYVCTVCMYKVTCVYVMCTDVCCEVSVTSGTTLMEYGSKFKYNMPNEHDGVMQGRYCTEAGD